MRLSVPGISLAVTPTGGLLTELTIEHADRRLTPLHRAPWLDRPEDVPPGADPHLAILEGDFFCAPFGAPDEPGVPLHGWPANGSWHATDRREGADGSLRATFALAERVRGATVAKEITLRPGHPVVYQRHVLAGGEGAVPIAHHAMIHVPGGARLSFSPKDFGATPPGPPEPDPARGRSILAYPQRFASLAEVALADGATRDLRRYPYAEANEDFLTLYDPPQARLGWSAAVAAADGFVFFALKDARLLTQTSLWMTNGGRSYAPWLSRHTAVLGIEETCTWFGLGRLASAAPNPVTAEGYRTAIDLAPHGEVVVRYVLGAIPADGLSEIAEIRPGPGTLTLTDVSGAARLLPFDDAFFA